MSILSNIPDLTFRDLFDAEVSIFNAHYFEIEKITTGQASSAMLSTFDNVAGELCEIYREFKADHPDSAPPGPLFSTPLWTAIRPYLKGGEHFDPVHLYVVHCVPASKIEPIRYTFSIWDDHQREEVFNMKFSFPA